MGSREASRLERKASEEVVSVLSKKQTVCMPRPPNGPNMQEDALTIPRLCSHLSAERIAENSVIVPIAPIKVARTA